MKAKASVAHSESNGKPKKGASRGGLSEQNLKKIQSEKFASDARLMADLTRCITPMIVIAMTKLVSPSAQPQVSLCWWKEAQQEVWV